MDAKRKKRSLSELSRDQSSKRSKYQEEERNEDEEEEEEEEGDDLDNESEGEQREKRKQLRFSLEDGSAYEQAKVLEDSLRAMVQDPRLASVESLQSAMDALQPLLHDTVLSSIDSHFHQKTHYHASRKEDLMDQGKRKKTKKRQQKRGRKKSVSDQMKDFGGEMGEEQDGGGKEPLSERELKEVLPSVLRSMGLLEKTVGRFARLEDSVLIQMAGMALSSLRADGGRRMASMLQQAQQVCMDLFRTMFGKYPEHRTFMLNELVEVLMKVENSQKSLRASFSGAEQVQIGTTTILELIQCVNDSSSSSDAIPEFHICVAIAKDFLTKFLDRCAAHNDYSEEEDLKRNRNVLKRFVEDLLVLLHQPEWPAAEVVLKMLCTFLAKTLFQHNTKLASAKEQARADKFGIHILGLLGHLLARIHLDLSWSEQNRLVLPKPKESPADMCSLCGCHLTSRTTNAVDEEEEALVGTHLNETLVQCQSCQRQFHAECLELAEVPLSFCCEDCAIIEQLEQNPFPFAYQVSEGSSTGLQDLGAFRQLYLNYLARGAADGSVSCRFAYEYCVAQWFATDEKSGMAGSKAVLEQQWKHLPTVVEKLTYVQGTARQHLSLPRHAAQAIVKQLSACSSYGLCSKTTGETLLSRLLGILGTGQPAFRAEAIKALGVVIEANPLLMKDPKVKAAVEMRVLDDAISVREATIKLVGRYVLARPELLETYQSTLLERLKDLGLSVRKRVVKILHQVLLLPGDESRGPIYTGLAERVVDQQEEDSVKELVVAVFRATWFCDSSCAPLLKRLHSEASMAGLVDGSDGMFKTPNKENKDVRVDSPTSLSIRTDAMSDSQVQYRTPMQSVRCKTVSSTAGLCSPTDMSTRRRSAETVKKHANDILSLLSTSEDHEWLVTLVKSVLGKNENDKTTKDDGSGVDQARTICLGIVETLVSELVHIQGEDCPVALFGSPEMRTKTLRLFQTIDLFCEAEPALLQSHVQTLSTYLKPKMLDIDPEHRTEVCCILLRMISQTVREARTRATDEQLVKVMCNDLSNMIFKENPQIMLAAMECLGSVCRFVMQDDTPLRNILIQFAGFLAKWDNMTSQQIPDQRTKNNIERAVLGCGGLVHGMAAPSEEVLQGCLRYILHYVKDMDRKLFRLTALEALGLLIEKKPQFAFQENIKTCLEACLTEDPEPSIRAQALEVLQDLLEAGEQKVESGEAKKELETRTSKDARVFGDQDTESSILAGLMQHLSDGILKLLFDPSPKVRMHAVLLVGTMLRQGLINPLLCIEPMITLESDDEWVVHQTAHQFLCDLDERHPEFLITRATQGVLRSFEYKHNVKQQDPATIRGVVPAEGDDMPGVEVFTIGPLQRTFSLFSRVYRTCISRTSQHRRKFFTSTIALFAHHARSFTNPDIGFTSDRSEPSLRMLVYVAETLATLPYRLLEEPLCIVFQVNKLVSLYGEAVRDNLKQLSPETALGDVRLGSCAAVELAILLQLKTYLKSVYRLTDAKCQGFNPDEKKPSDRAISNLPSSLPPFPRPPEEFLDLSSGILKKREKIYKWFKHLLSEDPDDLADIPLEPTSAKKRRKALSHNASASLDTPTEQQT